ncbi:MAG: SLOG family protein [Thiomonas arsenitoxydans]|jgi:hypothetical protein|nr:SLOG family protein [Thiomonas arsenitoxydans]
MHPAQNAVFVFGSNLAGIHGAGAALHAARWCGARRGQGEGIMGAQSDDLLPACYAIPTKRTPQEGLPLEAVAQHVEAFKSYARDCPKLTFQVTRIGCGLAGFADDQIAPLFHDAPANCLLPGLWLRRRDPDVARVIVAGSRGITDRAAVFQKIEALTRRLWLSSGFEIVSGMARGPDTLAIEWAEWAGFAGSVVRFPAEWDRYGKAAGMIRNQQMSWYGTHLLAFWDGQSPGTRAMIDIAKRDGLQVRVVQA